MRIIAGQWRSRRLAWPRQSRTRPMPDRVREAAFSMLGSALGTPGGLPALRVADVFAGGGSLGLEALSRGAASCRFFERDADALRALRRNLDQFAVGAEATIEPGDAWSAPLTDGDVAPFELVFLDPPYADARDIGPSGRVRTWLARLAGACAPDTMVLLHHERAVRYPEDCGALWSVDRCRTIGSNGLTFFRRASGFRPASEDR